MPHFLKPFTGHVFTIGGDESVAQQSQEVANTIAEWTSDPAKRFEFVTEWLDKAEKNNDFSVELDRHLGLPTKEEEVEKHSYHRRLLLVAGFVLAVFGVIYKLLR